MKKTMLLFVSILMIGLMGCSKNDDASVKHDWIFTITTVISVTPAETGYPMTSISTIEQDGLTTEDADQALKEMCITTSITSGGTTMTTTITATKALKK
jgi:hypothetical protein